MKQIFIKSLLFLAILVADRSHSQNLSAYLDNRNYFQAFDNGEIHQIEYLPVKSFKIGGAGIAYIDNTNEFKVYADQQKFKQMHAGDLTYFTTDYYIAFRVGKVLYVFEKENSVALSYYCNVYSVNDSVVCFFDDSNYKFSVYYKGKVITLESSLIEPPRDIRTGSNTIAYIDQLNYFKIFYQDKTFVVDDLKPVAFECGRDLVAYIDSRRNEFHLFYKGDLARVETLPPETFKVGYGIVAYIDNVGNFMVFDLGATRKLLPFRPDFYQVTGNMVVFGNNNALQVYYKGTVFTLENYIPKDMQIANDGIAYLDVGGRLKLFQQAKEYFISYETINAYQLYGNVLTYSIGTNTTKFFWNGMSY